MAYIQPKAYSMADGLSLHHGAWRMAYSMADGGMAYSMADGVWPIAWPMAYGL